VVVHNFDIKNARIAPNETDPPLPVDPDTVLPAAIAQQGSLCTSPAVVEPSPTHGATLTGDRG
jgi:hypothetical protein